MSTFPDPREQYIPPEDHPESVTTYRVVAERFPVAIRDDGKTQMLVPDPHCRYCFTPLSEKYGSWGKCRDCHEHPLLRDSLPNRMVVATLYIPRVSGYKHNSELIDLKERGFHSDTYAGILMNLTRREGVDISDGVIVPIPQTQSRDGTTGPLALAISLSRQSGIPMRNALFFNRPVKRQKSLGKGERGENVRGAMSTRSLDGCTRVILVDEIMTSGATVREAVRAVVSAGAEETIGMIAGRDAGIQSLEFAGVVKRVED